MVEYFIAVLPEYKIKVTLTVKRKYHRMFAVEYLSVFPVAPTWEHRAFVKRFVSPQFLNHRVVGRTACTGDQPVARPLPTQTE
jgi:hypothetical protein